MPRPLVTVPDRPVARGANTPTLQNGQARYERQRDGRRWNEESLTQVLDARLNGNHAPVHKGRALRFSHSRHISILLATHEQITRMATGRRTLDGTA
jgi:hypothetical protein